MTDATAAFLATPILLRDVGDAEIAYRRFGSGEPLLLLHGWPFSSFTYRELIPRLSSTFECVAVDIPGCGESRWSTRTDFHFAAQAARMQRFATGIGLERYRVLAHDTGATLARLLALLEGPRLTHLAMLNTEAPGHRPPWIPLFGKLLAVPGSRAIFRMMLRSRRFVRSSIGFGGCYHQRSLLDGDFRDHVLGPLIADRQRIRGLQRYLRGFDWSLVDRLAQDHARITCPTLFIWGEDDPTFSIMSGREMIAQLPGCVGLEAIGAARLLVHEERPEQVAAAALPFLTGRLRDLGARLST